MMLVVGTLLQVLVFRALASQLKKQILPGGKSVS